MKKNTKKTGFIVASALLVIGLASCEKKERVKETQSSVEKRDMVFIAASDNGGLKTTVKPDGTTVVWSATDKIRVFTAEDTQGGECGLTSGAGSARAEFAGQCAIKGPWTAICPSSAVTGISDGIITLTMPETQNYAENTFATGAMPCVAYSETNTFNFNHSFGLLKISLKLKNGTTGSVKSITVKTKGSEKLNGTFTVTPSSSAVAAYSTGGTSSITLNCPDVPLRTDTATDFWIVVPQGAFEEGFDVTVTPPSITVFPVEISTTKDNTIIAGMVNEMPVQTIEFVVKPTTGEAEITGGTKVKWVQLWAGGPKWAEYNVGSDESQNYNAYYNWGGSHKNGVGIIWIDDHDKRATTLSGDNDTATKLWGDNWRMPTVEEFLALFDNCEWLWTDNYNNTGRKGGIYKGKEPGFTENSVFFPAAGDCWGGSGYHTGTVLNSDVRGFYWSSYSDCPGCDPKYMHLDPFSPYIQTEYRKLGHSVRAVLYENFK